MNSEISEDKTGLKRRKLRMFINRKILPGVIRKYKKFWKEFMKPNSYRVPQI